MTDNIFRVFFDPSWCSGIKEADIIQLVQNLLFSYKFRSSNPPNDTRIKEAFHYFLDLRGIVEVTTIELCDAILIPIGHKGAYFHGNTEKKRFEEVSRQANALSVMHGKPILVHGYTKDISNTKTHVNIPINNKTQVQIPINNMIYISYSLLHSKAPSNYMSMPYFIPDYLQILQNGCLNLVNKSLPSVGFCGVAPPFGQKITKTWFFDCLRLLLSYLNRFQIGTDKLTHLGNTDMKHAYRTRVLLGVIKSKHIQTDFTIRDLGGLVSAKYWREPLNSKFHVTYFNTLLNNLYIVCSRGTENYSISFFETLSLGRIPIIVDSDLRLIFPDIINYSRNCCLIPKKDLHKAASYVINHFSRYSMEELQQIQQENRRIWVEYLSFTGFYSNIKKLLMAYQLLH